MTRKAAYKARFEIYGIHNRKYTYELADLAIAENAFNIANPGFKRSLSTAVDTKRLMKIDNVHEALKLVQANVPAADFRQEPTKYMIKVFNYMINN